MMRTDDPAVIEHRLLELAYTTDTPITAPALAYFAPCSLEDAERVLDQLAARDRIRMEVGDDGTIKYELPNRHKLHPRVEPTAPVGLAPSVVPPFALRHGREASPLLAAVLSLLVPGAGQLYAGNVVTAILWFILVGAGYVFVLPGLFLHLVCIATAASAANRLNSSVHQMRLPPGRPYYHYPY
jgi:TM2 domain-containing membrane protein YozV